MIEWNKFIDEMPANNTEIVIIAHNIISRTHFLARVNSSNGSVEAILNSDDCEMFYWAYANQSNFPKERE